MEKATTAGVISDDDLQIVTDIFSKTTLTTTEQQEEITNVNNDDDVAQFLKKLEDFKGSVISGIDNLKK